MASRNYKTGVIITGDAEGAVRAVNLTKEQLEKLNDTQSKTASGFDAAGVALRRYGSELLSVAKFAGTAAAALGTAAAAALVKLTKDGLESADALGKQADKLGIATEKIAAYSLAAQDTGVAQERVFAAVQRMGKTLVDAATGSDTATKALAALNLESEALLKLSPDQAFERIADRIAEIEDPILKSALAMKVFGKSGAELINFINLGSEGLADFARKTEIAGTALSREMIAKVEMANDSIELLGTLMAGFAAQLAVKVAPVLLEIGDRLFSVAENIGGMGNVAQSVFTFLVEGAGKIVTAWEFVSAGFYTVEAIMRSVNVIAATLIQTALVGTAALTGLGTSLGKEMLALSESFAEEATDEAQKRDQAWAAAAETVKNYGKAEEQLKASMAEITAAADKRAAAMTGMTGSTDAATKSLDTFSESVIRAVEADLAREKSLEALRSEQEEAKKKLEESAAAFNLANDPAAKFIAQIDEIKKLQESGKVTQDAINNATRQAAEAYAQTTDAAKEYAEAEELKNQRLEEGKRVTEQMRTPTEEYAAELEKLQKLLDEKAISPETFARATEAAYADLIKANEAAASQASSAWRDFGRNVQEAFRDTFIQAEGNLNDFLKRAEEALKEAARRWLFDATIGRLFAGFGGAGFAGGAAASTGATGGGAAGGGLASLSQYSGLLGSGGGGTGTGAGLFLRGANSLLNGGATYVGQTLNQLGYSTAANSFGTAYANTAILGNNVGQALGFQGGGALVGGAVTAGAGMAGGYVGNILGEGIFDKKAESNIGSTAGGIAGAYIGAQYGSTFGPWGAAIGAAIGALADVASVVTGRSAATPVPSLAQRSQAGRLLRLVFALPPTNAAAIRAQRISWPMHLCSLMAR